GCRGRRRRFHRIRYANGSSVSSRIVLYGLGFGGGRTAHIEVVREERLRQVVVGGVDAGVAVGDADTDHLDGVRVVPGARVPQAVTGSDNVAVTGARRVNTVHESFYGLKFPLISSGRGSCPGWGRDSWMPWWAAMASSARRVWSRSWPDRMSWRVRVAISPASSTASDATCKTRWSSGRGIFHAPVRLTESSSQSTQADIIFNRVAEQTASASKGLVRVSSWTRIRYSVAASYRCRPRRLERRVANRTAWSFMRLLLGGGGWLFQCGTRRSGTVGWGTRCGFRALVWWLALLRLDGDVEDVNGGGWVVDAGVDAVEVVGVVAGGASVPVAVDVEPGPSG